MQEYIKAFGLYIFIPIFASLFAILYDKKIIKKINNKIDNLANEIKELKKDLQLTITEQEVENSLNKIVLVYSLKLNQKYKELLCKYFSEIKDLAFFLLKSDFFKHKNSDNSMFLLLEELLERYKTILLNIVADDYIKFVYSCFYNNIIDIYTNIKNNKMLDVSVQIQYLLKNVAERLIIIQSEGVGNER